MSIITSIAAGSIIAQNNIECVAGDFIGSGAQITNLSLANLAADPPNAGNFVIVDPISGAIVDNLAILQQLAGPQNEIHITNACNKFDCQALSTQVTGVLGFNALGFVTQQYAHLQTNNAVSQVIFQNYLSAADSTTLLKFTVVANDTSVAGSGAIFDGQCKIYYGALLSVPVISAVSFINQIKDPAVSTIDVLVTPIVDQFQIQVIGTGSDVINWNVMVFAQTIGAFDG